MCQFRIHFFRLVLEDMLSMVEWRCYFVISPDWVADIVQITVPNLSSAFTFAFSVALFEDSVY